MTKATESQGETVLVCGGRNWSRRQATFEALDILHAEKGFSRVIHGAARGADSLAGAWAKSRGVPVTEYPANWYPPETRGKLDRGAGFKRNFQMLHEGMPSLVIAFPGGAGTRHMIAAAKHAEVTVVDLARLDEWLSKHR